VLMSCFLLAGFVDFDCFFFAPAFLWVMSYDSGPLPQIGLQCMHRKHEGARLCFFLNGLSASSCTTHRCKVPCTPRSPGAPADYNNFCPPTLSIESAVLASRLSLQVLSHIETELYSCGLALKEHSRDSVHK
jgi:hypothetical protein